MKPGLRIPVGLGARLLRATGVTAVFLVSLCLTTLVHLNTDPVRSSVAYVLNAALRQVFQGELRVQRVEKLSFAGARLSQVEVIDSSGTSVVALNGASVDWSGIVNLLRVVRSGNLRWVLDHVRVDSARVRLRNDPTTGLLTLVQALTLRTPPAAGSDTPGREVQVWLPAVEISEVSVRFDSPDLAAFAPRFVGVHGKLQVRSDGVSVEVERFGTTVTGIPGAELHGTGTFSLRSGASLRGTFAGFVGSVEVQAAAQYTDDILKVVVDAPRVPASAARGLWSDWPLRTDAELHATLEGKLPTLGVNLTAETERMTLEATGNLVLNPLRLHLNVDAAGLDLRDWADGAPATSMDSTATFDLEQRDGGFTFDLSGVAAATRVLDVSIPRASYRVRGDANAISLSLDAHEPGAQVSVKATLSPASQSVESTWKIEGVDLASQRRIPDGLTGKASLSGQLTYREGRVQVSAIANVRGFRIGDFSTQSGQLTLNSESPWQLIQEAKFKGSLVAHRVAVGSVAFADATLKLNGSRHAANLELALSDPDGRRAQLRGVVLPDFSMRDLHAALERGALRATADIASVNPEHKTIDVSRLQIIGPELNLEGRFRYAPELLDGTLHGEGVSLSRLAHLVGFSSLPVVGTADFKAEVAIGPGLQRGTFEARLRDVSVAQLGRTDLEFSATLRDDTLSATHDGKDAVAGPFGGSISATLSGPPLQLGSYRDAVGSADLEVRDVPLEVLGLAIPEAIASNLEGRMGVRVQLQRPLTGALPVAYLQLSVAGASGLVPKLSSERLLGLGALATGNYDPETRRLALSLALSDSLGVLATSSTQLTVDVNDLLGDSKDAWSVFQRAPLSINVDLPPRALASYPFEATRNLRGTLGAHLTLDGSLDDPATSVVANINDLTSLGFSEQAPISITLNGLHAPRSGDTQLFINGVSRGSSVIRGEMAGTFAWLSAENPPWQAAGKLTVDALPLERLAPLQALGITGSVSGALTWNSTQAVLLDANLNFGKLFIGTSPLGTGDLRLTGRSDGLTGRFDLKHDQSTLAVDLTSRGTIRQLEAWNDLESVDCRVVASKLNAAILSPFLDTLLARLGGKLDAQVQIGLVRTKGSATGDWRTRFDGTASLTEATGYIDALGLELQDVSATAKTAQLGALTQLRLSDIRAKARSETTNLRALSNLNFDGIRLVSGDVSASLLEVPLTLQGINLGRATGKAKARLQRMTGWDGPAPLTGSDYLDVAITLEDWRLHTTPSASRGLIALDSNPDILVAQRPPVERTVSDLLPYRFHIHLGNDVRVMLADQEVPLGGTIGIDLAGLPQFSGQVILKPGGRLLVLGRVFEVVNGTVRFNPRDASNPDLNLALSGRGLDGNTVYVSVLGTLQEPVTDPPPAKLQELLGGGTATAVSGGMQALGLGSLLGSSFQLRVSDSDPGESVPSYSAAVKIDEDLWFEANYQNEGNGLSQKDSAALSGTLDYRFQDNWSLRTKVGTTSGSLDLSWQYRY